MTTTEHAFRLPRDGEEYISNIWERCSDFIEIGVWKGVNQTRLRTWMNNFQGAQERYFAACILDTVIYRSTDQTRALMEHLFQRTLPDLARHQSLFSDEENWLECLRLPKRSSECRLRLVPVLKTDDPPTKSGPLLARMYRQHLDFNEDWMIWPWQIEEAKKQGATAFIFVDDFLGTGTQFLRFAEHFGIENKLLSATAVYAPLAAHEKGINRLAEKAPWLHICCVEQLGQEHSLFSQNCLAFSDGLNSPEIAKTFYLGLLRDHSISLSNHYVEGFGHLALSYVFEHATPNNCLPLFWHSQDNWDALFNR